MYHVNLIGPSFITCSQSGIWVLNQEVDFNLDLNWGLRSNLTHRFFIQYLAGCKCSLAVIFLPGTYFGTRAALAGALERWPTWSQAAIGIKVSAFTSYTYVLSDIFLFLLLTYVLSNIFLFLLLTYMYCLIFSLHPQVV